MERSESQGPNTISIITDDLEEIELGSDFEGSLSSFEDDLEGGELSIEEVEIVFGTLIPMHTTPPVPKEYYGALSLVSTERGNLSMEEEELSPAEATETMADTTYSKNQ
mgnify:CR=1 FL=1